MLSWKLDNIFSKGKVQQNRADCKKMKQDKSQ